MQDKLLTCGFFKWLDEDEDVSLGANEEPPPTQDTMPFIIMRKRLFDVSLLVPTCSGLVLACIGGGLIVGRIGGGLIIGPRYEPKIDLIVFIFLIKHILTSSANVMIGLLLYKTIAELNCSHALFNSAAFFGYPLYAARVQDCGDSLFRLPKKEYPYQDAVTTLQQIHLLDQSQSHEDHGIEHVSHPLLLHVLHFDPCELSLSPFSSWHASVCLPLQPQIAQARVCKLHPLRYHSYRRKRTLH
ncbi:uncharacterized protein G2W53_037182 [Senna tora]|uniref:Uncharacterized protein n=1 Tax=Senna tora TaxID=362788 RepID=A0A834WAW5_9FABA|nr:uncharacterized protein G2W53_037182 [Senna tora]